MTYIATRRPYVKFQCPQNALQPIQAFFESIPTKETSNWNPHFGPLPIHPTVLLAGLVHHKFDLEHALAQVWHTEHGIPVRNEIFTGIHWEWALENAAYILVQA
uniref:Uncharacterized protein n=1 Tax=Coccidioides posadasii RMSCC 3488 TaxID=454284 RepID=A0A0J6F6Q6_COCPO|nr:hypothetical protein CPAG_00971 [Coccidioides posadasii RMSCC 3488]